MTHRLIIFSLTCLILMSSILPAQTSLMEYGVKNAGMGFTGVSSYADVTSILYNPSLIAFQRLNQFNMEYIYNEKKILNLYTFNYLHNIKKIQS